jgi:hypothetical protein
LRQPLVALAVEVLGGSVDVGADGDHRRAVLDPLRPALALHGGDEVAHVARDVGDRGRVEHADQRVAVDLAHEVAQVLLDVQSLEGGVDPARHPAQLVGLLHQHHLVSLLGDRQRTGHAGDAAAHHQGGLVHRQVELLERLQMAGARHRHADDVLCLGRGLFFLLGMDPGAVLADVGHLEVVLVEPRLPQGVAEQRLERAG